MRYRTKRGLLSLCPSLSGSCSMRRARQKAPAIARADRAPPLRPCAPRDPPWRAQADALLRPLGRYATGTERSARARHERPAATLLRVRVVLMLTYVREPAVMVELAR